MEVRITNDQLMARVINQAAEIVQLQLALDAQDAQLKQERETIDKLQTAFNAASEKIVALERDIERAAQSAADRDADRDHERAHEYPLSGLDAQP